MNGIKSRPGDTVYPNQIPHSYNVTDVHIIIYSRNQPSAPWAMVLCSCVHVIVRGTCGVLKGSSSYNEADLQMNCCTVVRYSVNTSSLSKIHQLLCLRCMCVCHQQGWILFQKVSRLKLLFLEEFLTFWVPF